MAGRLKILELHQRAQTVLGPRVDIRQFHDVVLCTGADPFDILEDNADTRIAEVKRG